MVKSKAELKADINAKITANGIQAITGTMLNGILIDMVDSSLFAIMQQGIDIALTTTATAVVFPAAMSSADYSLGIMAFDGLGNPIDYAITNKLDTGFTIQGAVSGTFNWKAMI